MNFKIGDFKEAIMATILLVALSVGVLHAAHSAQAATLDSSITKALTCAEAEFCMSHIYMSDSAKLYDGDFEYEYVGRENLTVLGAADFYRISTEDKTYLFRVDSRKNIVIQYFKIDTKKEESELMKKYGLDY